MAGLDGMVPYHLAPLNQLIRGYPHNKHARQEDSRQRALENMYKRILGEMCISRFKWTGISKTRIDVRYMEMQLYMSALALVVRDDGTNLRIPGRENRIGSGKVLALAATPGGVRNIIGNPVSYQAYGPYYQGAFVQARDAVAVWGNAFRLPDVEVVDLYAWKLARMDRTIEINADHTRHVKLLAVDENSQLSAANIQNQIDQGVSVIGVSSDAMDKVTHGVIDLNVDPRSIEANSIIRGRIWSEAMGLLGINNALQEKKERVQSAEVDANNDQVDAIRRSNLNARQWAAEQMRNKFTELADVQVRYHENAPMNMPTLDETLGA